MNLGKNFVLSAKALGRPRILAMAGMFLALQVVLDVYLSVMVTPTMRVSFGFLSMGLSGALLGPVPVMLQAVAADVIAHFLKPAGAYFPGYSLTALLNGVLYGSLLFERRPQGFRGLVRCFAVKGLVNLFLNVLLNTVWSAMLTGKAFFVLLPPRALKNAISWPIESLLLWGIWMLGVRLSGRVGISEEFRRLKS